MEHLGYEEKPFKVRLNFQTLRVKILERSDYFFKEFVYALETIETYDDVQEWLRLLQNPL